MDENSSDKILFYFSRITFIVPIVVIVVGLFLYEFQKPIPPALYQQRSLTTAPSSSTTIGPKQKLLNVNGSYLCEVSSTESSISAYFKQKKLFIENKNKKTNTISYTLYNGGCLYLWNKDVYTGEKVCGLAQYESFLSMFGGINSLGPLLGNTSDIQKVMDSCQQSSKVSDTFFIVPRDILFKNTTIDQLK